MTSLPRGLAPQQVPSEGIASFPLLLSTLENSVCSLLNREDLSLPLEMLKVRGFLLSHKRLLNKSMKCSVSGLKKKKPVNLLN